MYITNIGYNGGRGGTRRQLFKLLVLKMTTAPSELRPHAQPYFSTCTSPNQTTSCNLPTRYETKTHKAWQVQQNLWFLPQARAFGAIPVQTLAQSALHHETIRDLVQTRVQGSRVARLLCQLGLNCVSPPEPDSPGTETSLRLRNKQPSGRTDRRLGGEHWVKGLASVRRCCCHVIDPRSPPRRWRW
jgi:hypothetical protein